MGGARFPQCITGNGSDADLSRTLDQVAEATLALTKIHAQLQMLRDLGNESALDDTSLAKVCDDTRRLTEVCSSFSSATEHAIFRRLCTIGGTTEPHLDILLKAFERQIKKTIRKESQSSASGAQPVLWKIAEVSYGEARDPQGRLNPQSQLTEYSLREVGLVYNSDRHYEPDWTLKETWQHLPVLQSWLDFWARTMMSCPSGPTVFRRHLFGPSKRNMSHLFPIEHMPRYLFRAFDRQDTSGGGSGAVVSGRWQHAGEETLGDLLSLDPSEALQMLLRHLRKPLFTSDNDSNLKSWSSSLMFVVRYAVWRAAKRGVAASEVQICVVDTTKFPPSQFLRDIWLLRAYKNTLITQSEREFVNLRLNDAYNNGEFFSQGRVDVAGRSAVFTLDDLWGHGLPGLYPELFAPPPLKGGWTKRVKTLRSEWSSNCISSRRDIDYALGVSSRCFGGAFDETEIVLLLMAFKKRWLNGSNAMGETVLPDEPIEVRRFVDLKTKFKERTSGRSLRHDLEVFFYIDPR